MKLLKFTADWCTPCKALSKRLTENPIAGLDVEEIDIEENGDLADEYRVRNLPTCVLLDGEKVVRRFSGYYPDLISEIKAAMNG